MVNALALPPGYARYTVPVGPLSLPLPGLAAGDYVEILAALPLNPASPAITATVQPIDAHALVVFLQNQPPALTLAVPRRELATLAWLRGQGAALSFALVGATDRGGDLRGVGAREFRRLYHVPPA